MATSHRNNLATWIADRREMVVLPLGIALWTIVALASALIASWR
jgi:hypothetical protein